MYVCTMHTPFLPNQHPILDRCGIASSSISPAPTLFSLHTPYSLRPSPIQPSAIIIINETRTGAHLWALPGHSMPGPPRQSGRNATQTHSFSSTHHQAPSVRLLLCELIDPIPRMGRMHRFCPFDRLRHVRWPRVTFSCLAASFSLPEVSKSPSCSGLVCVAGMWSRRYYPISR